MENKPNGAVDKWAILRYFLGRWEGIGTGKPGISKSQRTYALILADQFIEVRGRSVFEPQAANPSGEIHEELGLISFDTARSRFVLREFHVEGYINHYVLEEQRGDGAFFSFVTESIENIPPGWRARTTIEILSPDRFREQFDLAAPQKDWTCLITHEFQRVR